MPPWELEQRWAYYKEHALVFEQAELEAAQKRDKKAAERNSKGIRR